MPAKRMPHTVVVVVTWGIIFGVVVGVFVGKRLGHPRPPASTYGHTTVLTTSFCAGLGATFVWCCIVIPLHSCWSGKLSARNGRVATTAIYAMSFAVASTILLFEYSTIRVLEAVFLSLVIAMLSYAGVVGIFLFARGGEKNSLVQADISDKGDDPEARLSHVLTSRFAMCLPLFAVQRHGLPEV